MGYWFGIARGQRNAIQLLTDLQDSTRAHLGWPVYWAKEGAYFFDDLAGRGNQGTAHYWNLKTSDICDYTFHTISEARRLVDGKLNKQWIINKYMQPEGFFSYQFFLRSPTGHQMKNDYSNMKY